MNWDRIWMWWHMNICLRCHYKLERDGLHFRQGGFMKWLYKKQLPLCNWLDDKAHK